MTLTLSRRLLLILALGVGLRLAFALLTPAFDAADEYPHYRVAAALADGRLPVSRPVFPEYEGFQPPLYYAVAALALTGAGPVLPLMEQATPPGPLVRLRLLSVLIGLGTLIAAHRLARRWVEPTTADLATLFVAVLPTHIALTASATNDGLLVLLSTAALAVLSRDSFGRHDRSALLTGLLIGLALLTKLNALVLLPVAALRIGSLDGGVRRRVRVTALMLGPVAVAAALLVLRNALLYGEAVAVNPGAAVGWSLTPAHLVWSLRTLGWSFWVALGRRYDVHPPTSVFLIAVPLALAAAGIGWWRRELSPVERRLALGTAVGLAAALVASLGYTLSYPAGTMTSWGKNLYPVLGLVAPTLALGWRSAGRWVTVVALGTLLVGCGWGLIQLTGRTPPPNPPMPDPVETIR